MRVEHSAPSPDLNLRVTAPLQLEVPNGDLIRIERWSLSGLVWPEDADSCPSAGILSVPFQGIDIRFPVRLQQDPDRGLITLDGLSGRQRETLALFYRALLSGRMVSSAEVITCLDTPLDLVPMEETSAEAQQAMAKGWRFAKPLRAVANVVSYVSLMALVVGVVGNNILTNLDRIDIQHGRVDAKMTSPFIPNRGVVDTVAIAAGDVVTAGQILVTLKDPELEAKQESIRLEQQERQHALRQAETALAQLDQFRSEPNHIARLRQVALVYERFAGRNGFEDLRSSWVKLRERDPEAAVLLDPLEVTYRLIEAKRQDHLHELQEWQVKLRAAEAQATALHIRAETGGLVHEVHAVPGQVLSPAGPVILIEEDTPRLAVGWVSERFAETLYPGMPARIGINIDGQKQKLPGHVVEVRAGDIPDRPGEYGILVSVAVAGADTKASRHALRLGAPVNLEAERQVYAGVKSWTASHLQNLRRWLAPDA